MSPVPKPETRRVYTTDPDFVSTNRAEAAVLLASNFAGVLVRESPFAMRFPAAARPVAERRRKRTGRFKPKERRFFPKHVQDRM